MSDLTTATDAAARAWFDRGQSERLDAGRDNPVTGKRWQWEDLDPMGQLAVRTLVLPIVMAVSDALGCPDPRAHLPREAETGTQSEAAIEAPLAASGLPDDQRRHPQGQQAASEENR